MSGKSSSKVDGGQHGDARAGYDRDRTQWLRAKGYTVLRFWNNDVMRDPESVLEAIRQTLQDLPS